MSYLPLARKYRPQTFDELVGQPHVTKTLTQALESKRLGQAYLFTGLRGVGKTSAARILAKALNCASGPTASPCNTCSSCTQIAQGNSLDVIEIDGASNRGIDEIRNLRESVPYMPTSGAFRVYIIDEVHMLTTEAFNALLKTLEEPPAHVKFIFATTAPNKMPSTILSRCQRFDFRRLESQTIVRALAQVAKAERIEIDEAALYAIARAADGSLRDGEVVLEQLSSFAKGAIHEADVTELLGAIESEALAALTRSMVERNAPSALSVLAAQLEQGKDPAQVLLGLLHHLRNLLILGSTKDAPSRPALIARLVDEPAERLANLEMQAAQTSPDELLVCVQMLAATYELVRRSPMAQTILELVLIKLCTRERWQSLEQITRRLEQLSASTSTPVAAPAPAAAVPVQSSEPMMAAETMGLEGMWSTFLDRLGQQKMSLAAYLAEARPLRHEGSVLTVGLPAFALHQEVLNLTDNRRLIERLLGELLQGAVTVQYATLPASSERAPAASTPERAVAASPAIVQDIVSLFNATILDPPRPT